MRIDINKQERKGAFAGNKPLQMRTLARPCQLLRMKIGLKHSTECQLPRGAEATGRAFRIGARMARAGFVDSDRKMRRVVLHLLMGESQREKIAHCGHRRALRNNHYNEPLMAGILKATFDKSGHRR